MNYLQQAVDIQKNWILFETKKEEVGSSLARSQSDYLWFLLAAFEQTRNASAERRNWEGGNRHSFA